MLKCKRCLAFYEDAETDFCWNCRSEFEKEIIKKFEILNATELEKSKKRFGIEKKVRLVVEFYYD